MSTTQAWPELREELSIVKAPSARDGSPNWSIFDPVRNLYFRIDWLSFEMLCRWPLQNANKIVAALEQETTLRSSLEGVQQLIEFLQRNELTRRADAGNSKPLIDALSARKTSLLKTLLHRYLFFRVPLWHPDRWLERTRHWVDWCSSARFRLLTLLVFLFGLWELSRQWESFSATLVDLFTPAGFLAYAVTLIAVKFLHELGHAYSAKRRGCRVPSMGVAFLVMFPVAYTDVNDVWRLPDKRQQLTVGAAGIATELVIAVWATAAWALLPDGLLRTGCFLLASTTWISTLLVNASPFLRFDGYFLLMDYLEIPNLHSRAFNLARWQLRHALFDCNEPVPEIFTKRMHLLLVAFAWATWLYRCVVFLGIALLVYLTVPKPLGPVLAAIEVFWFILRPIASELVEWKKRWQPIIASRRSHQVAVALLAIIAALVLPWDSRVTAQGLMKPVTLSSVVSPEAAQLDTLRVIHGESVEKNTQLAQLSSPELLYQQRAIQARQQGLTWQENRIAMHNKLREQSQLLQAEKNKLTEELNGIANLQQQLSISASDNGILYWHQTDLSAGQWLGSNELLGTLVSARHWQVHAYVTETDLARIAEGQAATFFSESGYPESIRLEVVRIDSDATRVLAEPLLASTYGGRILVREAHKQLIPEQAIYRVTLAPDEEGLNSLKTQSGLPQTRGQLVIWGERQAWASHYLKTALALFRREAGF